MKLKDILKNIDFSSDKELVELYDIEIEDISYNSNNAKKNYIFVAIEGEVTDGHKYIDSAYENGSRIFVLSKEIDLPKGCIKILVKDTRKALSKMSANLFNNPSKELKIIGITGTKGKTTTSNYIKAILEAGGHSTGIIGTNGVFYKDIVEDTENTTPESYETQRILRKMLDNGIEYVVMEASSGGLKMNRVEDVEFDLGVFTNISKDHIGPREHPDFEDYLNSKLRLFKLAKHGIVNIDDKYGQYIIDNATCDIDTISIEKDSDFKAKDIEISKDIESLGSNFVCATREDEYDYYISSPGIFTIYNALLSIVAVTHFGIDYKVIKDALKDIKVSGRVELLPLLDYAHIVLDFAHNGVSLKNIVETLKDYKPNRLICMTGSVGGRSNVRRKEMADIAAKECDVCILTSDNPDFEDPMNIINEMAQSFEGSNCLVIKEADRKEAIKKGVNMLKKNDILLLAGKGHETYQLVKGEKLYFNDKEEAIKSVNELLGRK
ncbi:UDP-N-acetylmuramoyl-L-alanyl-D-glutamate--2,6-diaminopimelate ligase [Tissierella creatinophila]|uniref:UDP-N-acetylmuramyl-tripeptide synthetase n=1 Tax=Tissierella creatinophila DSM 6911 TaxID=1123403 RepID=A0A1U7M6T7_TISCR|nr:UDP-N-acetylmuramoyl-L-alanyl-D-glutamate--2,6-diaminopimelate ligase [Tissierella creatinophila]OLS03032.1 UDP-N-acetylmuramoyl-L-alanyl-D-glutamate--L-lysine ligase [Tissierella creatinophila DSM 6911]